MEHDLLRTIDMRKEDGVSEALSEESLATIMQYYAIGIMQLQLGFGIRMSWARHLPWMLMGLAHPQESRALHWAKECCAAFAQKPDAQHHRKSLLFLKPGSVLRSSIDRFIETGTMPEFLRLQLSSL